MVTTLNVGEKVYCSLNAEADSGEIKDIQNGIALILYEGGIRSEISGIKFNPPVKVKTTEAHIALEFLSRDKPKETINPTESAKIFNQVLLPGQSVQAKFRGERWRR